MDDIRRTVKFNPKLESFNNDPYPTYQKMREQLPLYQIGRTWVLTRYDDVQRCLRDTRLVTSGVPESLIAVFEKKSISMSDSAKDIAKGILLFQESDAHELHKKTLAKAFRGAQLEQLRHIINERGEAVFKQIKYENEIDVVDDIASPLWYSLITCWLGLSAGEIDQVKTHSAGLRLLLDPSSITSEGLETLLLSISCLEKIFDGTIDHEEKSVFFKVLQPNPSDVLERRLYVIDCITLLIGGSETTEALIVNALFLLVSHPRDLLALQQQPGLIGKAVQEVVRFESPLKMTRRRVVSPVELHGKTLNVGDDVLLCLGSANRDESQFENADRFDIYRHNNQRHLGFGTGLHQCIGQVLANMQVETACRGVLRYFPNLALNQEEPVTWQKSSLIIRTLSVLKLTTGVECPLEVEPQYQTS